MAASLKEMIAQKAELERLIAEATTHGKTEAISQVKALMEEHGLTLADLGGKSSTKKSGTAKSSGTKVAAKYHNKASGESWSGRGLQPRWLKAALASGKKIEDFAV